MHLVTRAKMCQTPNELDDGTLVACHKCWQCRSNRVEDWVGRCIAESETAVASHSVTLTYGERGGLSDHVRAAVLTYSDVTKYIKLLRRHGYPLRYFAVGEYGSLKGRAHWHLMLFWQERVPEHRLGERFQEEHWPHGFSHWERAAAASVRYICKYIQKDIGGQERQGHLSMSKKPPLGAEFFRRLAGQYVAQGLSPQEPTYKIAGESYYLSGRSLDLFLQGFLDQWASDSDAHPPRSELLDDYLDRQAHYLEPLQMEPFRPRDAVPWLVPPGNATVSFSESHNAYSCRVSPEALGRAALSVSQRSGDASASGSSDGVVNSLDPQTVRLFWSFDEKGERAWQGVIRTETQAEALRERHAERTSRELYRIIRGR